MITAIRTALTPFKSKAVLVVGSVLLVVGLFVGWHAAEWWFGPDWKKQVQLVKKQAEANERLLKDKHAEDLRIVESKVQIKEVIKYVTKDTRCDLPAPVVRMLDESRGVPTSTAGTTGSDRTLTAIETLPARVEVAAHADCGVRFQLLANRCQALIDFHKE